MGTFLFYRVLSEKAINATTVEVTFKEAIKDVKALGTFTVVDKDGKEVEVKDAVVKQTNSKTVVLTTAALEGKEYTVKLNGDSLGKFSGISNVIPTSIKIEDVDGDRSYQGVIGNQVTVSAKVTVPAGQSVENIPVTFNVVNSSNLNEKIEVEALTNAEGVATYTYTRYYGSTDTVTAYATSKSSVYSTGKVYWANAAQLTVKDITTDTTLVNGAKKVYQIESSKNAGKYVFVTFAENLSVTPDKLTKSVVVEGVNTYAIKADDTIGADQGTSKYPYEVTTGGKAVTAVKLDSNGKANLVLTGSNASATPIVFEGVIKTGEGKALTDFSDVTYNATALQAKASTVKFELKHSLGLTIEAQGVQDAALRNTDGIGGRDYVVTYTNKDGKAASAGTKVLVAIPKAGLSAVANVAVYDEDEKALTSVTSDSKYVYYNVTVGKEGKATFTVTSSNENDYIAPVAFINNGTSAAIALDDSDLQSTGAITYFVSKVEYSAKLKLTDGTKSAKSFVAGKESAYFNYVLVDQNGKSRKADAATEVSFEVYAGTASLTIAGQGTVPAGNYKTVKATIAKGSHTASIKVDASAPTDATVTATGSKAGIVLTATEPASVTATFTQFATASVTGVALKSSLNKTSNTFALVDDKGKVHVYKYEDATLLQNSTGISEGTFEALIGEDARITVTKDDAGKLTFNVVATGVSVTPLTAQQAVDVAVQVAVINNDSSVTLPINTSDSITIDTSAPINVVVNLTAVGNLTINAPEATTVDINGAGVVANNLNVTAGKATVTVDTGVTVIGTTNIHDVNTASFVNKGTLAAVNIYDANGTRFVNNGSVSNVNILGTGSVLLAGTQAFTVNVNAAADVQVQDTTTAKVTLNVNSTGASVTDKSGKAEVKDSNESKVDFKQSFIDINKLEGQIDGVLQLTATDSSKTFAEVNITKFIITNGSTTATVDATDKLVEYKLGELTLSSTVTVKAVDKDGKITAAKSVTIADDKTGSDEAKLIQAAQEAVDKALESKKESDISAAKTAIGKLKEGNTKAQLTKKIEDLEKSLALEALNAEIAKVTFTIADTEAGIAVGDSVKIGEKTYNVVADETLAENVDKDVEVITVSEAKKLHAALEVAKGEAKKADASKTSLEQAKTTLGEAVTAVEIIKGTKVA